MRWKIWLYGLLTLIGLMDGVYLVAQFVRSLPVGEPIVAAMVRALVANPMAAYALLVVLLCFVIFLVTLVPEGRSLGMRYWWLYAVLALTTPFAFALPLFFWMRERKLADK